MADFKKVVLIVRDTDHEISLKKLERRAAIAKRKHPEAEIAIRIVNRWKEDENATQKDLYPLGAIVAAAEAEHMSYGEYVAQKERHAYISARKPNKPSAWVHPNRTLIEGLDKELTHLDSRAEWLMDPRAKEKLMEQQAQREANRIAEQRVCTFLEATEAALRKAGKI